MLKTISLLILFSSLSIAAPTAPSIDIPGLEGKRLIITNSGVTKWQTAQQIVEKIKQNEDFIDVTQYQDAYLKRNVSKAEALKLLKRSNSCKCILLSLF
jgi:hypothetical protein